MVGAAGPPVMLDSGVAVATTGKVVRFRGTDSGLLACGIRQGAADIEALDQKYRDAFATRASRRNRDSTIDNLRDLAALTGDTRLGELAESLANRGKV